MDIYGGSFLSIDSSFHHAVLFYVGIPVTCAVQQSGRLHILTLLYMQKVLLLV